MRILVAIVLAALLLVGSSHGFWVCVSSHGMALNSHSDQGCGVVHGEMDSSDHGHGAHSECNTCVDLEISTLPEGIANQQNMIQLEPKSSTLLLADFCNGLAPLSTKPSVSPPPPLKKTASPTHGCLSSLQTIVLRL